ncbi:uncharacterized protein N0V89_009976 [Didymosphaeria variabile]|uniref:Tyrosinase copper-binding domain-containing protein n=1 Tax=Didymosphaeria variabile TaxID=1932322 RepID=A0A9W9C7S7_9PLEO|nr:uncharacterized protein N0V89_009976 [Didymosphaeria variabile]KAJ4348598.1 hypothetical protein N0V89_009976 [Didymosphaeria variabile]
MKFLAWTLALPFFAEAAPTLATTSEACTIKNQRKAWHTLTRIEKLAYITAEKCLMTLPAKLGLKGPRTRFDEFQKVHVLATESVHFVGAFLPFHRYLIYAHESILQTECNYTGAQPYWDEPLDAGNFSSSVVLDAVTGFGGNGAGLSNCVNDGPFKDYVNAIGPFQQITDHCIDRRIDDCASAQAASKDFRMVLAMVESVDR